MAIKLGDKGAKVIEIQQLLGINVDGDFGVNTQTAVINFQREYNLTDNGIVDTITLTTLRNNQEIIEDEFIDFDPSESSDEFIIFKDFNLPINTAQIDNGENLIVLPIDETNLKLGYKVEIFLNGFLRTTIEYNNNTSVTNVIELTFSSLYPENDNRPGIFANIQEQDITEENLVKSPKETRNSRNQEIANQGNNIETSDLASQINEAATQDSKPKGIQRFGKFIVKLCLRLKDFFLPQALALLTEYGINQLQSALDRDELSPEELKAKFCPTPVETEALILQRNNLAAVLNNVGTQLELILKGVTFAGQFVSVVQGLYNALQAIQTALNAGAITIPFINKFVGPIVRVIAPIADDALINKDGTPKLPPIKNVITQISPPLTLLQALVLQCVNILDRLDDLILLCNPNATLTATSSAIDGIVATQLIAENTETGNTYKGFVLEIETRAYTPKVDQNRAVGKNNQGIVLITTDYSFASDPNVLIDELKFIIDRDNLKAY